MKSILIIFIIAINIFSIVLTWKMLKGFDLKKKIIITIINEIINFVILLIIYAMSQKGISKEIHEQSKWMTIYTILPINIMIVSSTLLNLMNKIALKEISEKKFNTRFIISIIAIIVIFIMEIFYMHNIQISVSNLKQN